MPYIFKDGYRFDYVVGVDGMGTLQFDSKLSRRRRLPAIVSVYDVRKLKHIRNDSFVWRTPYVCESRG